MFKIDSIHPRDMIGYGRTPPDPKWPGGVRIAVEFVAPDRHCAALAPTSQPPGSGVTP